MIVKCEKCKSEFNLNDSLIKNGGSMVRCSICKNVFKVFPPKPATFDELIGDDFSDTAMEETVALDMPPDLEDIDGETYEDYKKDSFDKAFEEAIDEVAEDEGLLASEEEAMPGREETAELLKKKTDTSAVKISRERPEKKSRPRILLIILSIVLFLVVAFVVIFFYFPDVLPDSIYSMRSAKQESGVDSGVNNLDFEGVIGSFVTSEKTGRLYIIEGSVINNDQKSRSHIMLKGSLCDKQGSPLVQETAYAGNTLTDEQLNTLSINEMKQIMQNKTGINNNNVGIKPGASVPFMIIFSELPEGISEFELEAIGSSY
ncbi:MAG: zinc-ribbon domain-containing protein [Deltaproteobacteria bacterium]|nr:zinc-ribbon domain-containing protein [Deltaproteobacteria bacterium]